MSDFTTAAEGPAETWKQWRDGVDRFIASVASPPVKAAWDYWVDACQRTVLFWDVLRQRGNLHLEHTERGKPPVLVFEHEILLDARDLPRPCNYLLMRILPQPGMATDAAKRPYVIVDPRAGHGPGIGGFKSDSQVGMAMRAGHPVYFVSFLPDPVPGQTLADVARAEARFIEEVAKRHPRAGKPCVIGNCQAGWAVAALAAVRPELVGPIVLNGAPLSYWAGSDKQNPMRYAGATLGGSWLASMAADLGNGEFDGAHLVANFENLNPANTLWSKPYNLYANVDTEAARFLEFEKWWGGIFKMTTEEIELIVNELFMGNQLARRTRTDQREKVVNLANIKSPVVVFASFGDNITPPQQALNWIIDVYGHEDAIVEAGRVIVYLLHEDIGHLGIFVSGKVAKKEHKELVNVMDMIEGLPPGLYEMVIEDKPAARRDGDLERGDYTVRFELRTIDDIRAIDEGRTDEALFSTIAQVSEMNRKLYDRTLRPFVRAATNETTARWWSESSPNRLRHVLWSNANPLMAPVSDWAERVRQRRRPVAKDNPFVALERAMSDRVVYLLNAYRDVRDDLTAQWAKMMYGPYGWGAWFPPQPPAEAEAREEADQRIRDRKKELESRFEQGDKVEGLVRILLAMVRATGGIERRAFLLGRQLGHPLEKLIREQRPGITDDEYRELLGEQMMLLKMDQERALRALPKLLPSRNDREEAIKLASTLMMQEEALFDSESKLAQRCKEILGVEFIRMEAAHA